MRDSAPWAMTNHGTLLDPARAVADLGWVDARDVQKAVPLGDGHWWLVVSTGASCEGACDQAVTQLRQLHVLLNRDQSRVRRAVLFDTGVASTTLDDFESRYPKLGLLVRHGEPSAARDSALGKEPSAARDSALGKETALEDGVYIVDPHGNVILSYAYHDAGKPVLEDLQKLLKVSQIG